MLVQVVALQCFVHTHVDPLFYFYNKFLKRASATLGLLDALEDPSEKTNGVAASWKETFDMVVNGCAHFCPVSCGL